MPEDQLAVVGYNVAGLDPIEVAHSSTGTTLDLSADTTAYRKMHVMSGTSANYTCILPTAVGHEGETIGFRGSNLLTATVTLDGSASETLDNLTTRRLLANEARYFRATSSNWVTIAANPPPFGLGALSAYLGATQTGGGGVLTKLNINTLLFDVSGWYNTTTNTYSPTLSGYYSFLVTLKTTATTANNQLAQAWLYKNGIPHKQGALVAMPLGYALTAQVSCVEYVTTVDSYQPWGLTTAPSFQSGATTTHFQALYLGGV